MLSYDAFLESCSPEKRIFLSDKVYLSAKIVPPNQTFKNHWMIIIDDQCHPVVLNQETEIELRNLGFNEPLFNVKELRNGAGDIYLISGGSFPWIIDNDNAYLVCIKRGIDAPSDPGLLTGPAGRCESSIIGNIIDETNQEVMIIINDCLGKNKVLFFVPQKSAYPNLMKPLFKQKFDQAQVKTLGLEPWVKEMNPIALDLIRPRFIPPSKDSISFIFGNGKINNLEGLFVFLDQKNHTLEIRMPFIVSNNIPLSRFSFFDSEFDREVGAFTPDELCSNLCVPTLDAYVRTF